MNTKNLILKIFSIGLLILLLQSCGIYKPVDARKVSPNPDERVKKNMDEGRGFRLLGNNNDGAGGNFSFASSNELWRATLDILDFIPIDNADYGGGIIITDWFSEKNNLNESIKITVRFLTNEIRSDALDIDIFKKNCSPSIDCNITKVQNNLNKEIEDAILRKAAVYFNQREIKKYPGKVGEISPSKN